MTTPEGSSLERGMKTAWKTIWDDITHHPIRSGIGLIILILALTLCPYFFAVLWIPILGYWVHKSRLS